MTTRIPTRHPESPRPVPGMIKLVALALGIRRPSSRQWARLGERLMVGDAPMDRLLDWMVDTGLAQTRPLFDKALADGIDGVADAPQPLRDFFATVESLPAWVDPALLRRGQRALRRGGADGMYIARDVALLGGYQFSGFNKTLLRTGALEKGSNKRFAETMQWALDVISEGGLEPLGIGYRSTIRVRLIHAFVRRHVGQMPDWRDEDWGVPVNQTDMAATLVGALIAPPVGGLGMGILTAPEDLDAIAHVTRYVGWLIGVEDEWLPGSFWDAIAILFHTLTALSAPDESTPQLAAPMADDPLMWHYEHLSGLRRRLARFTHLSVTSAFLGPRAMKALGLPAYVPPWYPLMRLPVNVVRSCVDLATPGGMDRAARRGEQEQLALLRTMIGSGEAAIGESAAHVSRVA